MYAHRGDIFFTHSDSLLGWLIRWGEREHDEEASWTNHTGVVTTSGYIDKEHQYQAEVVEALWHTRRGPMRLDGVFAYRVFRPKPWYTDEEKGRLIAEAYSHVGERYGWWKLFGFLLKRLTLGAIDVTKWYFLRNRPICSFLSAWAHEKARPRGQVVRRPDGTLKVWNGFGVSPRSADPDTMMDYCVSHPDDWEEIV